MDGDSAERAGGVTEQPHINTIDVEAVLALGQEPPHLTITELAQAHRALHLLLLPFRREDKDGQGPERCHVHADGGGKLGRPITTLPGKNKPRSPPADAAIWVATLLPDDAAAGVDMEAKDEHDDGEDNHDGGQHDLAA